MNAPITIDLVGCARCLGEGHEGLIFQPLTHPVEFDLELMQENFTHWALCPTNGEPILMSVTKGDR